MEFLIVGVIVIVAGYIFYSNIKNGASGDCGCGNGCKGCDHSCGNEVPNENNNKIK